MLETADKVGYAWWDSEDLALPSGGFDCLEDALTAFYSAGGYDFFKVIDPQKIREPLAGICWWSLRRY